MGGDLGSEPSDGRSSQAATQSPDLQSDLGIAAAPTKGPREDVAKGITLLGRPRRTERSIFMT